MSAALATCPACNGTTRQPASEEARRYRDIIAGYDKADDTVPCGNCGGQAMSLRATGRVRIDPATGLGCLHSYRGETTGRCLHTYTCAKCGDRYSIDSGD